MATCDPLQPVVLLTDVMDSNFRETETDLSSSTEESTPNPHLFQVEQTEPLNLCLNGSILNGFTVLKYCPNFKENGNLREQSDDDVIFVKEYKVNKEKLLKRSNGLKLGTKGAPRRNPVRKARVTRRFKEYTDVGFDEEEFLDESADDDSVDSSENFLTKNEDSEDWKMENIQKKTKRRRRVISRKLSHKLGRKRKIIKIKEEEKKVTLKDLESLIQSNLLLIKDYISDIKIVNKLSTEKEENQETSEDRTQNAVNIFKQQVILLAIAKEIDGDLTKYITE